MPQSRAIVWIDEREARVFRFGDDAVAEGRLRADAPLLALRHRTGTMQAGDLAADLALLDRVVDSLRGIRSWCLTGPDGTRDYLLGFLEQYKSRDGHIARLLTRLAGVATLEQPTDAALLDQVRLGCNRMDDA
jgi:hypothetical protein